MNTLLLLLALQIPVTSDTMLKDWRPDSAVAYDSVPAIYNQWWKDTQDCAGVKELKLNRINWFSVKTIPIYAGFPCPGAYRCFGWWKARGHEVFIAHNQMLNEYVIKHEMLHEILWDENVERKFMEHHKLFQKCGLS